VTELAEIVTGWPLAATLAVAITAGGVRAGRRRAALNQALHELRRPLQAICLAPARAAVGGEGVATSLQMARAALERLDREINGGTGTRGPEPILVRPLLASAVGRWRARASLGGGALELRWGAGEALVIGDRTGLAQAFDNLIVNAIEHGGPSIEVEGRLRGERLRISVADSGRDSRPPSRRGTPAEVLARLAGRNRHGHGLSVVRGIAASHDGRFALRHSEHGSLAVLELPLAVGSPELAA
jgi:signal transduction histidine kinase